MSVVKSQTDCPTEVVITYQTLEPYPKQEIGKAVTPYFAWKSWVNNG